MSTVDTGSPLDEYQMDDSDNPRSEGNELSELQDIPELPTQNLKTYARLWQFETWLREMVYVEIRAQTGDNWETKVKKAAGPRQADKRLTHMPTREEALLSYAQLSELSRIVADDWSLFEGYFPPKDIWEGKLAEISQIRHRVAHFRRGHRDDLTRVVQFLRDIDHGFWNFCTSYNDAQPILPQDRDPLVKHFFHLDLLPWTQTDDGKWARIGAVDPREPLFVTIEVLRRPWAEWAVPAAGQPGLLYEVRIHARQQRHLDLKRFLDGTKAVHRHLVHICLDGGSKAVRVTIPACLGQGALIDVVTRLVEAAQYCVKPGLFERPDKIVQDLANTWPEYVLGPQNPLTFLSPDMPCSFFAV
ncbi:hypothetical protein OKW41_006135 [Paraburkholderia sp. UCT70]|uniref:hypothetical protein n=1 Tax=Paraburkholderia sp. UCT70 TaxID=2991068 RepID=UPI003D1F8DC6